MTTNSPRSSQTVPVLVLLTIGTLTLIPTSALLYGLFWQFGDTAGAMICFYFLLNASIVALMSSAALVLVTSAPLWLSKTTTDAAPETAE